MPQWKLPNGVIYAAQPGKKMSFFTGLPLTRRWSM